MAIRSWVALGAALAGVGAVHATAVPYQATLNRWRAADGGFASWDRAGVVLAPDGSLLLDPTAAQPGDGGASVVGEATSPVTATSFAFKEAIASWNAGTPAGTWVETLVRARLGARWTKWYSLGIWAESDRPVQRHSVNQQGDADGTVEVDTLKLNYKKVEPANAYQVKVRLFSAAGAAVPSLSGAAVATSTTPGKPRSLVEGNPAYWSNTLAVPACSQMVYPDGGTVWCSPTSVSMVLAYWQQDTGPCEPRVRAAVAGVYDLLYDGHGNWPFNTAYAAARGYESWVGRFMTMAEAERWLAAGVPLVISYAWGKGDLTGAPVPASNGHLVVLVGFDADGNPVINDPAAASDADVRRTYPRAEVESLWLRHSGGTVYAIYPAGWPIPD
jgi:hypothetical protein